MINWQNRILTNVKLTILGEYNLAQVVSTATNMPAKFPAVCVAVVSAPAIDLGSDEENAINCVVQIDVYSKVSDADAMKILESANSAMYRMGFKRREKRNGADSLQASFTSPDIHRVIARYTRVIGANDVIDRFVSAETGETGTTDGN